MKLSASFSRFSRRSMLAMLAAFPALSTLGKEMAFAQTAATTKPRKGLKSGVYNEFAAFLTVRPGHLQQLKEELSKRFPTEQNQNAMIPRELLLKVGNCHVKHYLFDNDQRLALILTFNQSFDKYFDDFFAAAGVENFYSWLQHCSEIPEELAKMTIPQIKDAVGGIQTQAFDYIEVIPDITTQQIAKAQKLMTAFQGVLDNPDAAQALKNPALKPLLDLASG